MALTRLERAKKFHKHITGYQVMMEPDEGALIRSLYAQARVARALIRQEQDTVILKCDDEWEKGYYHGLKDALDILDAVYGREK